MLCLKLEIMNVGVGMKAKLLDEAYMLMFLLDLLFLLKLVLVLAEIHNLTDRRHSIWHNFNKIFTLLLRYGQSISRSHYAKLLAVIVDYANLHCAYFVINAGTFTFDAGISYAVIDFCWTSCWICSINFPSARLPKSPFLC